MSSGIGNNRPSQNGYRTDTRLDKNNSFNFGAHNTDEMNNVSEKNKANMSHYYPRSK